MGNNSSVLSNQIKNEINTDPIVIFSTANCDSFLKAKDLLNNGKVPFKENSLTEYKSHHPETYQAYVGALMAHTGSKTVPQIFICGQFIGGFDDIYSLNKSNLIVPLIANCSRQMADSIIERRRSK
uniref:Glutaredoxin domain-containing protein n=1 Tax=Rhabditophanes sp. KR3021 TaxID=114890 RepID=A0AC35TYC7_9BILA